ncbi:hypothetical protein OT109_11820 [Phycisphaeraceae bacterium D3-23]
MPLQIAENQPGFKAWAVLSSLVLGVMCLLAGACVIHMQSMVEIYDIEFKTGMRLGMRLGLTGFAIVWCGYMVLLAFATSTNRYRGWLRVVMSVWVVLACLGMIGVITGWFGTVIGWGGGVM